MSLRLANELWGGPDQLVPTFFTVSRRSLNLSFSSMRRRVKISATEGLGVVVQKKPDGISVFTGADAARRIDVTTRTRESNPAAIEAALRRAIGGLSFRLISLDPYLKVTGALIEPMAEPRYQGTIIFPYVAELICGAPEALVRFDHTQLTGGDINPYTAPTLAYDVAAAVEAVK